MNDVVRTDQSLLEDKLSDPEGGLPHAGRGVDETVQNRLQVELDDCTGHTGRHVTHLLQVLLLGRLGPLLVFFDHPYFLLLSRPTIKHSSISYQIQQKS